MRLPWRRNGVAPEPDLGVPADWIERRLWCGWEAPRNYVAGEQSYLAALTKIAGPTCRDGYCLPLVVSFVREPRNRYDSNAFRAEIGGRCVGYMRRHVAAQLAGPFDSQRVRKFEVCGIVRGGSETAPYLGVHVWLGRALTPGVALEVPPENEDPEWCVPWPPAERELAGS